MREKGRAGRDGREGRGGRLAVSIFGNSLLYSENSAIGRHG